ncbi:hypothetical protein GOP47_0029990 [Adiantum capillus-veneris]|nr:hypothetical protein GOP47_0029990 [Adiantum capillus-veneris]
MPLTALLQSGHERLIFAGFFLLRQSLRQLLQNLFSAQQGEGSKKQIHSLAMDSQGWDLNSDCSQFDNDSFIPSSQLEQLVSPPLADGVLVHTPMPFDRVPAVMHAQTHSNGMLPLPSLATVNSPRPASSMARQPLYCGRPNSLPRQSLPMCALSMHPHHPLQRAYNITQAEMGRPRTAPPVDEAGPAEEQE